MAYTGRIAISSANDIRYSDLRDLKFAFPKAQLFPGGEILVASTRCRRWNDGSHELNAKVYRPDGSFKSEFCLGDGIQHLQIDNSGLIWVGYFDEGVFGNYGWDLGPDTPPIGEAGLLCFDPDGNRLWDYWPPEGVDPIADCYVLNCANDAVWVCTYTHFPIVRIDADFRMTAWHTDISGPSQMAVRGDRMLVYGGYRDKATQCWLLKLGESHAERIAEVKLQLPAGVSLDNATVVGRDRLLHVFTDDVWYRFEVPRV